MFQFLFAMSVFRGSLKHAAASLRAASRTSISRVQCIPSALKQSTQRSAFSQLHSSPCVVRSFSSATAPKESENEPEGEDVEVDIEESFEDEVSVADLRFASVQPTEMSPDSLRTSVIAKKIGMMQIYDDWGERIAVTVLDVGVFFNLFLFICYIFLSLISFLLLFFFIYVILFRLLSLLSDRKRSASRVIFFFFFFFVSCADSHTPSLFPFVSHNCNRLTMCRLFSRSSRPTPRD